MCGQLTGPDRVPAAFLTGPVGVGKTAVATALGELLEAAGASVAVLDLDWLGWAHLGASGPSPDQLIALNLSAVWPNFRAAGMQYAVLARALVGAPPLEAVRLAVPDCDITVVRLTASFETMALRLGRRDSGAVLEEHLREARSMADVLDSLELGGLAVSTDDRDAASVAAEVMQRLGWPLAAS